MLYRPYGKQRFNVSAFGMGCMRLPLVEDTEGKTHINHEESIKMIRYAIDNGVNYLDTSYVYNNGESEEVIGEALEDGYRQRVHIATKIPPRIVKSKDDMRRAIETQLKRLRTDYIDVYLLHHLDKNSWVTAQEIGMVDMLEKFKSEGLIGAPSFSYHGQFPTFSEIIGAYDWAMCQFQHNMLDVDSEITDEGINLAYKKGMALVVMEPLRGGGLAHATSEVQALYNSYPIKRSPVEWAFRFVYNYPQISCVLSGVTTMEQLVEDIAIFKDAYPNVMTSDEKQLIANAKKAYESKIKVGCTGCEYCMPCPNGVPIPRVFATYNRAFMFNESLAKNDYKRIQERSGGAEKCLECGLCESHCPQRLSIMEELKKAHTALI